jgi:hypothetical protein
MREYSTGFNAALLTCADAAEVVRHAAAVDHMAATVKSLAAARAAEAKQWKASGFRSAEEQLARSTGSTVSGARDALALGQRLAEQPEVSAAARRGDLSPTQASAIADAVAANPSAAPELVGEAAAGGSIADLKNRCAEVKAAAVDLEERRRSIHRRRRLRHWTDPGGEWHLAAIGNPEDGAQIMAALGPLAEEIFHQARRDGRREHPDAYRFDALVRLAVDATSEPDDIAESTNQPSAGADAKPTRRRAPRRRRRGAPVKLLIRVDLETLMRGFPVDGDTCDLVGYGPISVSAVHKLIEDGDPFVAAILTKGKQLAGVAHLGRQPTAHQRSYLQWIYPTCASQGCPASAEHLEIDHRIDWSATHLTLIDWLDGLCRHDHLKKTRYGWSLVDGVGKRPFVPPTDPRHPRYKPPPDGSP